MKKIGQLVGKRFPEIPVGPDYQRPHPHTSIGIEIEVEKLGRVVPEFKRWTVELDGSLINGTEFISDPVWGTAITDALEEIGEFFTEVRPYISFRCSVHIHMNVLDLDTDELERLLKLGIVYEPAFFRLHPNRDDNIFCVPVASSYKIQQAYANIFQQLRRIKVGGTNFIPSKYAAINLNNLFTLGTVEYRHMGGSTDIQDISDWIDVLLQMKAAAILDADLYDPDDVWGDMRDRLEILDPIDIERGAEVINNLQIWSHNVRNKFSFS